MGLSKNMWQPISTAPKDGEGVLVFSLSEGILISYFHAGDWCGELDGNGRMYFLTPTHWMPLPEPPDAND